MLEKIDLKKEISDEEYKAKKDELTLSLAGLQRDLRAQNVPVMIVFEGLGAAGKGVQINHLIQPLDPRGFDVLTTSKETEDEHMHPFLWRFWTKTPAKGRIAVYDNSWYRKTLLGRFDKDISKKQAHTDYIEINSFEKQLTDDGTLMIKFFLYISKKEQAKRFKELLDHKGTAWRVSDGDVNRNKDYSRFTKIVEEMLQLTDVDYAPWTIIEAENEKYATIKILSTVEKYFKQKLAAIESAAPAVNRNLSDKFSSKC